MPVISCIYTQMLLYFPKSKEEDAKDYRWNNWSDHKLMNNLELTILVDFLHSFAGLNSWSASFPSLPKEMLIF